MCTTQGGAPTNGPPRAGASCPARLHAAHPLRGIGAFRHNQLRRIRSRYGLSLPTRLRFPPPAVPRSGKALRRGRIAPCGAPLHHRHPPLHSRDRPFLGQRRRQGISAAAEPAEDGAPPGLDRGLRNRLRRERAHHALGRRRLRRCRWRRWAREVTRRHRRRVPVWQERDRSLRLRRWLYVGKGIGLGTKGDDLVARVKRPHRRQPRSALRSLPCSHLPPARR